MSGTNAPRFGKCDEAKSRCKKALDLIGDVLLSGKASLDQLRYIEQGLMHAVKYGEVIQTLEDAASVRKAAALLKAWEAVSRRREIQRLRKERTAI